MPGYEEISYGCEGISARVLEPGCEELVCGLVSYPGTSYPKLIPGYPKLIPGYPKLILGYPKLITSKLRSEEHTSELQSPQ